MFIDSLSNSNEAGFGLYLKSSEGIMVEDAIRLNFHVFNNEVEYIAFIAGLKLVIGLQIKHLKINTNSALVASQWNEEFTTKDGHMISYLALARNFESIILQRIPMNENAEAHKLAMTVFGGAYTNFRQVYITTLNFPFIQE